jgi:hypothetical protein
MSLRDVDRKEGVEGERKEKEIRCAGSIVCAITVISMLAVCR